MRKRRKTSLGEDLLSAVAALPWWLGVALAVVSYFIIHPYAVSEVPAATTTKQFGQMTTSLLIKSFAFYGQYIVPALFLGGALASYFGRKKRESLVREAAEGNSAAVIRNMSWQDFELLVGELFRMQGYSVAENGGGGADGGVDLALRKGKDLFLVQCKRWREFKVPVNVVRELYGVMAARGAAGGFVVTSGVFTADAAEFAKGRSITLIDGESLQKMLPEVQKSVANARNAAQTGTQATAPIPAATTSANAASACPRCGGEMLHRVAKKGPSAGQSFWGCATFPQCTGVRKME